MSRRYPSLESLRFFEASARHRNFTRAAAELRVTPTAVSLRIRNLEMELGQRLFTRNGPRIALTQAGEELARRMSGILAQARLAVDDCRELSVPLRVTTTPTFARRWLVPRLASYERLSDAATIRLDVSTDLRNAAEFDVAIRSGGEACYSPSATFLLPILRTPMLSPKLLSQAKVRSPSDLARLTLLWQDKSWSSWFEQVGVRTSQLTFSSIDYETQDMEAVAAAECAGVALLSPLLFQDMLMSGSLVQPFDHVLQTGDGYQAILCPDVPQANAIHFVSWLRESARASLADYELKRTSQNADRGLNCHLKRSYQSA